MTGCHCIVARVNPVPVVVTGAGRAWARRIQHTEAKKRSDTFKVNNDGAFPAPGWAKTVVIAAGQDVAEWPDVAPRTRLWRRVRGCGAAHTAWRSEGENDAGMFAEVLACIQRCPSWCGEGDHCHAE